MRKFAIFMLMLLLTAYAENVVAINSMDGRDVLSGVFYANVVDVPVKFMPVPGGNADVFAAKVGADNDVLLIEGSVPISTFVESALKNKGNTVELYESSDGGETNLDLAKRSGATKFIIVDSAFSDSALSVLPYAAMTDSYVILANSDNINEVEDIVKGAEKIIIYGYVDSEVSSALSAYNPETIGEGEDKFEDNVEMVKKTMNEFSLESLIMVDGTTIEETVATGDKPVLLTGRLVPTVTYDFMKSSVRSGDVTSVMLVGNKLVVPIYDMREEMEKEFETEGLNKSFGIIVKFAQVVPSAGTGVLVLDEFPLPAYQPKLQVKEIVHNDQNDKLMISIDNTGEGPAYFTHEVRVKVDGSDYKIFGSNATKLVQRGEALPMEYDLDLSGVAEGNVTALVLVKYGSSMKSLENFLSSEGPLATISYTDESEVAVQKASYDAEAGSLRVTMKNNGNVKAYVLPKVQASMGGSLVNVTGTATSIDAGSLVVQEFPLDLSAEDLKANQNVTVFLDYGARDGFLMKQAAFIVDVEQGGEFPWLLIIGALVVVVLLIAVAALVLMKKGGKKR